MWLFVAFLAVPLVEIALFIQIGGIIGPWPTLLIVVLTALLGTFLVRQQGLMALGEVRSSFNEIRDPTEPLAHGAMILFSGALLLTPGFFTDSIGFLLLIPQVRRAAFRWVRSRVNIQSFSTHGAGPSRPRQSDDVIDGEYYEIDDIPPGAKGNSGWTKDE